MKYWLNILYLLKLLKLGDDMCQQLIGWKNNEIKKSYYLIIYDKSIIINSIKILNNVPQVFGYICNNNKN